MEWAMFWGSRSWIRAWKLCKNLFLQRIIAVEKEPGGSEESRELTTGNWCSLESSTGRKIKSQLSWGSWQFKDSDLSRVGGTWKRACVPWSGLAECCHFPPSALCFILFFFQQPKLYLLLGMWPWQGSLESQKSGAQRSQWRKKGGELGHGTPWPSVKAGSPIAGRLQDEPFNPTPPFPKNTRSQTWNY